MLGYLFYDQKDIDRGSNRNFINWLIEAAEKKDLDLRLVTQTDQLVTPDFTLNRSRHYQMNEAFDCLHINSTKLVKIANDKWLTYLAFKDIVKMMPTYPIDQIKKYPCIVKHKHGHGGGDVHWVDEEKDFSDDYIGQDIAPVLGKDLRVYIMDNQVYVSILRTSTDFKSNYSLGGQASLYELNDSEHLIIRKILNHLPMDYGGIDFLFDEEGHLILNELEDPVGAMMVYNLTDLDVVDDYLNMVKKKLNDAK